MSKFYSHYLYDADDYLEKIFSFDAKLKMHNLWNSQSFQEKKTHHQKLKGILCYVHSVLFVQI